MCVKPILKFLLSNARVWFTVVIIIVITYISYATAANVSAEQNFNAAYRAHHSHTYGHVDVHPTSAHKNGLPEFVKRPV